MDRALIVSAGQSSNEYLARHLAGLGYQRPTIVASCGEARRALDSGDFQVVVINAPLPDEFGHEFAMDVTRKSLAGVVFLAKAGVLDSVSEKISEYGILVLPKPFSVAQFMQAVRMAGSCGRRLQMLQVEVNRLQEKLQQQRLVERAKCHLIEHEGMTEADAHRYLEKQAMDTRRTRAEVAEAILEQNG